MWGIFGTNWRDVMAINGATQVIYLSKTNITIAAGKPVIGYPSGFV
jgi:hypothetical protein